MHWLHLVFPELGTECLQHSWEVVSAVICCVIIDRLYLNMAIPLPHAQEVLHECFIWLHLLKVKHEGSKVLEGGHLHPLVRVLAKLVEQHH